ncbi:Major intrinsic protein [Nitrosotalea sinensis]|uniref:Major intrinsic protein n=1 Tax=Nitrosotalea sinensis TaxID=1499975 RepID=A0A2H1EI26_9ARCH|nr:aquaporin [Candidatus Nitrosotalea sinensis]SHO46562.1 Major intrinsic protein [Candidatus Nitrosotalea sinensis]
MLQKLNLINRLTSNQKRFFAELLGTFVIVVFATGSVVLDVRYAGKFGLWFVALAPAVAVALMVYLFAKISMAHFNPAVTVGFLITRHTPRHLFPLYLGAEIIGAILGSLFVKYIIGADANLGANAPDYHYPIPLIIGVEVLATALLMSMILLVVHKKGFRGFGSIMIGCMVGLDIFFLAFVSGASMNPARSLAPALVSGYVNDLWLYWTATFVGSSIAAVSYRFLTHNIGHTGK